MSSLSGGPQSLINQQPYSVPYYHYIVVLSVVCPCVLIMSSGEDFLYFTLDLDIWRSSTSPLTPCSPRSRTVILAPAEATLAKSFDSNNEIKSKTMPETKKKEMQGFSLSLSLSVCALFPQRRPARIVVFGNASPPPLSPLASLASLATTSSTTMWQQYSVVVAKRFPVFASSLAFLSHRSSAGDDMP